MASRHLSRIAALQALFASDIRNDFSIDSLYRTWEANTDSLAHGDEDRSFTKTLLKGIVAKRTEIDQVIMYAAPQWPLEKIAVMDRNILRLGLYELLYGSTISVPPKVALNESIELAKTFGGDTSSKFINGVMGAVYREMGSPRKSEAPKGEDEKMTHAGGVVVCAKEKDTLFIALILDPFHKWTVPRSSIREGELAKDAALRAAQEELGLSAVSLIDPLGEHTYLVRKPGEETLSRHAMYFLGITEKTPLKPAPKQGVRDAQWFPIDTLPEDALYNDLRILIELGITKAKKHAYDKRPR